MTTVERLSRWKADGAITAAQHDALVAIVRNDRFSLFLELNLLLYLGVLSLAGGIGWTLSAYSARLGDVVVLGGLTAVLGGCLAYCRSQARPFSAREVESPNVPFDYVLYAPLDEANLRVAALVRAWTDAGLLAPAQRARLETDLRVDLRSTPLLPVPADPLTPPRRLHGRGPRAVAGRGRGGAVPRRERTDHGCARSPAHRLLDHLRRDVRAAGEQPRARRA